MCTDYLQSYTKFRGVLKQQKKTVLHFFFFSCVGGGFAKSAIEMF